MRRRWTGLLLTTSLVAGLLAVATAASAQTQLWGQPTTTTTTGDTLADLKGGGAFGLGFTAGSRNGLTMKIWPSRSHGIVIDVGAPTFLRSMAIAIGYRAHFKPLVPASRSIAALPYFGINFRTRLMFIDPVFAELGGGLLFGASVVVPDWPVELFVEAGPMFVFWKDPESGDIGFGLDVDGLAGIRLYF